MELPCVADSETLELASMGVVMSGFFLPANSQKNDQSNHDHKTDDHRDVAFGVASKINIATARGCGTLTHWFSFGDSGAFC